MEHHGSIIIIFAQEVKIDYCTDVFSVLSRFRYAVASSPQLPAVIIPHPPSDPLPPTVDYTVIGIYSPYVSPSFLSS